MPGADQIYHRLFSHPLMVEQLTRDFLHDAMAAGLDFQGMERVTAKAYGQSGARRDGDIIWRIPTDYGSDIYLYLLLEFQSQSDPWMPVRTMVYQGLLWQQIIAEKRLKTGDRLPPVMLVVLYNGGPRWSAETSLERLIALPEGSPLWHWQPQVRYHLFDMGIVPDVELAGKRTLAALLVRLEQRQRPETLVPLIDAVIDWFRNHPGYGLHWRPIWHRSKHWCLHRRRGHTNRRRWHNQADAGAIDTDTSSASNAAASPMKLPDTGIVWRM